MRVRIALKGVTPLIMHQDAIEWKDWIDEWTKDPENKKKSVAGDDRTPGFTWIGALYHDGEYVTIPSDNIMTMLRDGGAKIPLKGKETYKKYTQSGLIPLTPDWEFFEKGQKIPVAEILALKEELEYSVHQAVARRLGFELFAKRGKINRDSKHIRVRPLFRDWSAVGEMEIVEDIITRDILQKIVNIAGRLCGLGDWRPSAPKSPGSFGRFTANVEIIH